MADEVQIDSLSVAIEQSANDSSDSLARLSKNLRELKSVTSGLRLTNTVNGLNGIGDAVSNLDRDKVAALGELGGALAKISGAGKISSSFAKQITGIGAAIDGLGDIDTAKLTGLADALSPLAALDRAKLTSYINQLKQLPEVADALDGMDMDRFAASIRRTADAMKPLADEMEKVSNGFSALPTKIQRIIRENERMTASTKRGATGWKAFWKEIWGGSHRRRGNIVGELLGITSATTLFFKARDVLVGANTNINDYIENLNLYGVAMGKYAREQFEYAKTVEAVLGINPSQWTRMQAVIQDMTKSFGVAEGTATLMSRALTQLTFDYASFYNLSTDEAANKVRSAIAGEIEPVRALGKDLSVAKLQLTATELGINGTVEAMTQADKAMLRTITLLRQSESAQGDLARTLDDPANQMRILAAQTEMLSTALGELLLPTAQEVLPYAIATVKVLRMVTEEFARLAGFELPDFESTSATEEVESLGGAFEDAADAAKELYQLSFDELNILGAQVGGGLAGTDTDKLTSELERLAAIQDAAFMKDVEDTTANITEAIENWLTNGKGIEKWVGGVWKKFEDINEWVHKTGEAFGLWDFPEKVWTVLQNFGLEVEDVGIRFGGSELDGIEGEDHLKENVLGGALGMALLGGGALALLGGKGGARALTFGLGLALSVGAVDMLYDSATASGDTGTRNGLYQSVKGALEAGLLGTGLGLLSGKGLNFSLGLGLTVASVKLGYEGITGIYDSNPENDLESVVKNGLSAALLGTQLMLSHGAKGLKYTFPLTLGITGLSLVTSGITLLSDNSESNDLLGAVSAGLGGLLSLTSGAAIGAQIAKTLGASAIAGAGWGLAASIPLLLTFSLLWNVETTRKLADKGKEFVGLGESQFDFSDSGMPDAEESIKALIEKDINAAALNVAVGSELSDAIEKAVVAASESNTDIADIITDEIIIPSAVEAIEEASKSNGDIIKEIAKEIIFPATEGAATQAKGEATTIGKNIAEGTANGITESKETVETATKGLADSAMLGITTALGIHSPSTVFWDYGLNIDEGLANGVTDNMTIVTFAFDNVWQSIRSGFSSFASSMISGAHDFVSTLDSILSSISYGGGFSTPLVSASRIPAFASGGIVEDGLFMANSTELVGRFANGRTAVANNQQITDGIANGVREANHELISVIYATAQQIVQAVNEGSALYLDGERVSKKVTNAQNRANRMHGATMQNV